MCEHTCKCTYVFHFPALRPTLFPQESPSLWIQMLSKLQVLTGLVLFLFPDARWASQRYCCGLHGRFCKTFLLEIVHNRASFLGWVLYVGFASLRLGLSPEPPQLTRGARSQSKRGPRSHVPRWNPSKVYREYFNNYELRIWKQSC